MVLFCNARPRSDLTIEPRSIAKADPALSAVDCDCPVHGAMLDMRAWFDAAALEKAAIAQSHIEKRQNRSSDEGHGGSAPGSPLESLEIAAPFDFDRARESARIVLERLHILADPRVLVVALALAAGTAVAASGDDARLVAAIRAHDLAKARGFVAEGVAVNALDPQSASALHWAAHLNDLEAVQLLLQAHADPNLANRFGVTPMHEAATVGNAEMLKAMLDAGLPADMLPPEFRPKIPASDVAESILESLRSEGVIG